MHNFITARLNKDNFWNVMFFLLFFISLLLGYSVPQPVGSILALLLLTGAIVLVRINCPLTFDKDKLEFTTSSGKESVNILEN